MKEYFLKYPKINILKNYILKDPICDFFEIYSDKYKEDENTYYKNYIIKESNDYKLNILKKIIELSGIDVPLNPTFNQTKELIYNDSQLIIQGILLDKNDFYVTCDVIISYKLFKNIFPKINNLPFHLYCTREKDYLLINICYNTLNFKIDLKDVQNEGYILYKKCSMFAFREVFYELSGFKPECFLLGKEYYYKNTLLPKKEFIAKINFDEKIKTTFKKSIEWIKQLKENYHTMKLLPKPSCIELYPNMNACNSKWENEKLKIANEIKEITLVWNITYEERCNLFEKNIICWDDPKLLKELKETKKKKIQERMIHMNQQNDILMYPRKNISSNFKKILEEKSVEIYFDIESFLSFDEKQDLFLDTNKKSTPVIAIIGFIFNDRFYDITINNYSIEDEKRIIKQFSSYLYNISKGKTIHIYHWGNAENTYFQYIHKKYPRINFPNYKLINVLDYFRTEPIIIQGIFKFGLKSVGKSLYNHGLIKTTWEENDSGLDTMIQFKDICEKNNKNIPLKRYVEINEIIEYNRIDCQVLYEIVELLREKYD